MEKLTLEHISPYLFYGLIFKYDDDIVSPQFRTAEPKTVEFLMNNGKPVLRPMDLTKPIQVYGKEVVPIGFLKNGGTNSNTVSGYYDSELGEIKYSCCDNEQHELIYTKTYGFQRLYRGELRSINQLPLFKWLYKHKFDVDGLIEKGLAIDVNTFETNPYE